MKQLFIVLMLTAIMSSCSLETDVNSFRTEILPIEDVDIPIEFVHGQSYEITVSYFRPSNCHIFNDFVFDSELNQSTVFISATVYENNECSALQSQLEQVSFDFQVVSYGVHVFKFWQGKDDNGNDTYYIVEVPVVE